MKIFNPLEGKSFVSQSFDIGSLAPPIDLYGVEKGAKKLRLKPSQTGTVGRDLDINAWLPMASVEYNISSDIRDYVIVPIPATITGHPNTNGDCANTKDMLKFNVQQGRPAYKTFAGKPTFQEHANQDHTKAKGIILDSFLRPMPDGYSPKHARLVMLLAFDRTRDSALAGSILTGHNTYSMGMYYDSYTCSICNHTVHQDSMQLCSHTKPNLPTYLHKPTGKLCYRICHNITGFECSHVGDPAFISAINRPEHVLDPRNFR